ncbi:MAG: PIN domain-containing protein [Chloroflexota bacterium]|nr:PIN domain-containing protein [Chloroflexota bacterium]
MIAVDTNILVYSTRTDSPWYQKAQQVVARLAEAREPWAIPWPCIHEFLAVVTHPRLYKPATPLALGLRQAEDWIESPSLVLLGEGPGYFATFQENAARAGAVGGAIHDARIAALCLYHGVATLYSADRDFSRFPQLRAENPLV